MRLLALTAVATFTIDQASKYGVVWGLGLIERGAIDVLPPLLRFRMGWNTGVNFGLFAGGIPPWALIALAIAICGWMLFWIRQDPRVWVQMAGGLLIGGALGNVIDRAIHGAVIDFLNMSCCGIVNPYTFNLADVGVFAGAIALVISPPREPSAKTP